MILYTRECDKHTKFEITIWEKQYIFELEGIIYILMILYNNKKGKLITKRSSHDNLAYGGLATSRLEQHPRRPCQKSGSNGQNCN